MRLQYQLGSFTNIGVAAAKINAMLAEKGIQIPVKLPQVIAPEKKDENKSPEAPGKEHKPSSEEFVKDIPINDIKNRYLLTKGATQTQIQKETGAGMFMDYSTCIEPNACFVLVQFNVLT